MGIIVTLIVLLIAVIFISILITYANRRKKLFIQEKQSLQLLFKEQLLQSQLETQEQTLQHLSTELHDNLGALASLIKINLLTVPLNDTTQAAKKLDDTADLARQLITDIKSLSVSLNSDRIARKGFYNSLATEIERINKTGEFIATLTLDENLPAIENDKAIILYRMIQEVLNNMVKHSQAQNIDIDVKYQQQMLQFIVTDNGIGFNPKEKMELGDGAGLHNLQKRAGIIGAEAVLESSPGHGTKVTITLGISPSEK